MAIAKNKRRYSVTLTPANVDRLQAIMEKIGFAPHTMSQLIDEQLNTVAEVFEQAYENNGMSLPELFTLMGKQMKETKFTKEVAKNDKKEIQGGKKKTAAE